MPRSPLALLTTVLVFVLLAPVSQADNVRVWIPGWKPSAALTTPRAGGAVLEVNGTIYALGGIDGKDFLASTEMSRIGADGQLAPWQTGTHLTEPRGFFDAAAHNDFIYAVGGGNGPAGHNLLRSIERAALNADGSLGPWKVEPNLLNLPRRCAKVLITGGRIYALGGFSGTLLNSVESAPIQADGSLGPWRLEPQTLNNPRYVHAAKALDGGLLVVGGHNEQQGVGLNSSEVALLDSSGLPSAWQTSAPLATGRYGLSLAQQGGFVYAMGGLGGIEYLRSIEKAKIGARGVPEKWELTNPLPSARANFGVVSYREFVYVVGGTNQDGYFDAVDMATSNQRGDLGFWGSRDDAKRFEKEQTSLPRQAALPVTTDFEGRVEESINAGGYSYLRLRTADGEEWIATGQGNFAKGQKILYSAGVAMTDFHSRALNRTFAQIRFVSRVITAP